MADQNVIRAFLRAINTAKASPREAKALFEAGIVESGLRNLSYGDRDSKGALQQRASTGWLHATDPYRAALDFLAHARQANAGGSAGQLAQSVQRSAFPGRYDQNASQAARFLQGNPGATAGRPGSTTTTTSTTSLTPDAQQARRSALAQFVLSSGAGDPLKLAEAYAGAGSQTQTTRKVKTTGGGFTSTAAASGGLPSGVVQFDGKPVAAWVARELQWAKQHGWTGGVTSGYRSFADQQRIYNSGVRPAARPGTSNHEGTSFPRGAVDVTNAQQLAQVLARKPGGSPLKPAGAKDPPHFSAPHGGGY